MLVQIDYSYKHIVPSFSSLCKHFEHSCNKFNILAKISPAFITSLFFRVRLKFDKYNSLLIISCTLGWFSHHFVHHPARLHSSLCKLWYPLHFWNAQVYVWRLGYCFLLLSNKCTCSDCSYQ